MASAGGRDGFTQGFDLSECSNAPGDVPTPLPYRQQSVGSNLFFFFKEHLKLGEKNNRETGEEFKGEREMDGVFDQNTLYVYIKL